jgi:hypothetical protein
MLSQRKPIRRSPRLLQPRLVFFVWLIAFHCLLTVVARADVRVVERKTGKLDILISGTITERDTKALQELSAELERDVFTVYLDSKGGEVLAAMQIGRLIRKNDGQVWIGYPMTVTHSSDAKCYSSCALIFIAGVWRFIDPFDGSLGLHRPYLASVPQSRQAVEKQVPLMLSQVKQYVAEMGITDNFYQQMVNTEPSQMVVYHAMDRTESESAATGFPAQVSYQKLIPEEDPVYQEVHTSYDARAFGVTTSEMRQRETDREGCERKHARYGCQAILWGLSERVFDERVKKVQMCWIDDDRKVLQAMPKKERRDHPLWIKRETCIRNIMLGGS